MPTPVCLIHLAHDSHDCMPNCGPCAYCRTSHVRFAHD
jgi:hypothetical protein